MRSECLKCIVFTNWNDKFATLAMNHSEWIWIEIKLEAIKQNENTDWLA